MYVGTGLSIDDPIAQARIFPTGRQQEVEFSEWWVSEDQATPIKSGSIYAISSGSIVTAELVKLDW
jgi:hypothetical protein